MVTFPTNKSINMITALGGAPFVILLLSPEKLWLMAQLWGVAYLAIIISFIAGISWCMACLQGSYVLLSWGIILSLSAWMLAGFALVTENTNIDWLLGWFLLNLAWMVDRKVYLSYPGLRTLRLIGTITLNVCVIMIIVRNLV